VPIVNCTVKVYLAFTTVQKDTKQVWSHLSAAWQEERAAKMVLAHESKLKKKKSFFFSINRASAVGEEEC